MAQWYVKELSRITKVSVQTLHHYDRIGLLKPSLRLPNGYRLYSEKDLLKLQQIIALKYFGFELSQIKTLLAEKVNVIDHFSMQLQFLEEKTRSLADAAMALKSIIADCRRHESIPWETIIQSIEVYRMTQEFEKTWVGKALSPDELKEYAKFASELKTRFTAEDKESYEKAWDDIVKQVNANLDQNPAGPLGIAIGKRCMDWVNSLYTPEHAGLRTALWEKGFKGGHGVDEHGLSLEAVTWLDQAHHAYYQDRMIKIFDQVEKGADESVRKAWNALMVDMFGDNQQSKDEFVRELRNEWSVRQEVKEWLR